MAKWFQMICGVLVCLAFAIAPGLAQDVEKLLGEITPGDNTVIVDDRSSGFQMIAGQEGNTPTVDTICPSDNGSHQFWAPTPVQKTSPNPDEWLSYEGTVHWSAQYRPAPSEPCGGNPNNDSDWPGGPQLLGRDRNVGRWSPSLSKTGCYEIWTFIGWNSSSQAPYKVNDSISGSAVIPVRQYAGDNPCAPRNRWVRLGGEGPQDLWKLNRGGSCSVELSDETGESDNGCRLTCVVWDACAFLLKQEASLDMSTYLKRPGEPPFANRSVNIYEGANGSGQKIATVQTDGSASATYLGGSTLRFGGTYSARDAGSPNAEYVNFQLSTTSCVTQVRVPVCLGSITARKFSDCNMNGRRDSGEAFIPGWPMRLTGVKVNGEVVGPIDKLTDGSGAVKFADLDPGDYVVSELGNGIAWQKVQTTCGATSYCDWRTSWGGKRWQATQPRPPDNCNAAGAAPSLPVHIDCNDVEMSFGNVELGEVKAFKFHDMNLDKEFQPVGEADAGGDQKWTAAEPFTDLNCNGKWDDGEYFNDLNGNKTWAQAEAFADADGDGSYDWPECPVPTWPFALTGLRADGRPICPKGLTGADGWVTFPDIPPSNASGYRLAEDDGILHWCSVNLGWPDDPILRCSYTVNDICTGAGPCRTIDRWQATTTTFRDFVLPCGADREEQFGNICLARVDGVKLIYDDGMPGQADPVFRPWAICLAGKDHYGRDVIPSASPCTLLPPAGQAPITIPCQSPAWYETICSGSDGTFSFVDLLPGHYHLTEQPDANYRMAISRPMLSGFDVMCCPEEVEIQNIRKDLAWKVYQTYPGDSNEAELGNFGYGGMLGDLIRAVPGALKIVPGENWTNYKQGTQLCRETPGKSTVLTKKFDGFSQCGDVFYPLTVSQQGTPNIRLWWPLMYEPPTTSWTLRLIYGTKTAVRFPGESREGYVHEDVWRWVVETDIPHMKLFLDLLREAPFGLDEAPLISDEVMYPALHAKLDAVQAAVDAGNKVSAGLLLGQFEMQVMDACIAISPAKPFPTGPGTGIANSFENPACCKLLVDAEHVGKTLKIFQPTKD